MEFSTTVQPLVSLQEVKNVVSYYVLETFAKFYIEGGCSHLQGCLPRNVRVQSNFRIRTPTVRSAPRTPCHGLKCSVEVPGSLYVSGETANLPLPKPNTLPKVRTKG